MTTTAARTAEALLPLVGVCCVLFATMFVFLGRCLTLGSPRTPYIQARDVPSVWKWLMEWWVWLWGPVERACLGLHISPNAISLASTLATGVAAWLLGGGALALGGWVYLLAASLDLVDGRVARAQGTATPAGAFLDSTLDRLSELLVFGGLAVHFRLSPVLYGALASAGASMLVSYARARGEGLGVTAEARVGGMQRAERVVLTGAPCALSPILDAVSGPGSGELMVGSALAILAVLTTLTAARRSLGIWRALRGPVAGSRALGNVRWLESARKRRRLGH